MIEVGRDKADLKAVRESIGITQIDLANELRVTVRTIKRWEQIGWEEPPAEVWDLLEDLVDEHERAVERMVDEAEEECAQGAAGNGSSDQGDERPASRAVRLAYYKNQRHYDCFDHPRYMQHTWGNAVARRAADILRMRGYRVFFYYPETGRRDVDDAD